MNFFTRYPPKLYSAKFTGSTYTGQRPPFSPLAQGSGNLLNPKPSIPLNVDSSAKALDEDSVQRTTLPPPTAPTTISPAPRNPFLPWKNPESGRWQGAKIGLRRQADLVKLAKAYGVESLLPPGMKSTAFKEKRTLQQGLRVKGTGEGQTVKGHKWERNMSATMEKRRIAMEGMPGLIRRWKQLGHGRGWKKYPSGKSKK